MGNSPTDFDPVSLETPTLKSDMYTTGRGGSGNMTKNSNPEVARRAQDVVGYVPIFQSPYSFHVLQLTPIPFPTPQVSSSAPSLKAKV
jgi:hypothetical protein